MEIEQASGGNSASKLRLVAILTGWRLRQLHGFAWLQRRRYWSVCPFGRFGFDVLIEAALLLEFLMLLTLGGKSPNDQCDLARIDDWRF